MSKRRTIRTRDINSSLALGAALTRATSGFASGPDRTLTAEMIDSYVARVTQRQSSVSNVRKRFGTNLGALLAKCQRS